MNTFEKHELFEIELLDKLKSHQLLQPLVFGGGTMLRLCHGLERYSVDLDFWLIKKVNFDKYSTKLRDVLQSHYEITDEQEKFFTLLAEVRSGKFPRRLKIEIRKEIKPCDFQDRIAFCPNSSLQVILRTHTLSQTMINKIEALQTRNEIRDAFDIEFLLRKGIAIPALNSEQKTSLLNKLDHFSDKDFKVKLGSILESKLRNYYVQNRFSLLREKLAAV